MSVMRESPLRDLLSDVFYYLDFIILLVCLPVMMVFSGEGNSAETIIGLTAFILVVYLSIKCLIKYKNPFIKVIAFFILAYMIIMFLGEVL